MVRFFKKWMLVVLAVFVVLLPVSATNVDAPYQWEKYESISVTEYTVKQTAASGTLKYTSTGLAWNIAGGSALPSVSSTGKWVLPMNWSISYQEDDYYAERIISNCWLGDGETKYWCTGSSVVQDEFDPAFFYLKCTYSKKASIVETSSYQQGTYVGDASSLGSSDFPVDGLHSDGYWYVLKDTPISVRMNNAPVYEIGSCIDPADFQLTVNSSISAAKAITGDDCVVTITKR